MDKLNRSRGNPRMIAISLPLENIEDVSPGMKRKIDDALRKLL